MIPSIVSVHRETDYGYMRWCPRSCNRPCKFAGLISAAVILSLVVAGYFLAQSKSADGSNEHPVYRVLGPCLAAIGALVIMIACGPFIVWAYKFCKDDASPERPRRIRVNRSSQTGAVNAMHAIIESLDAEHPDNSAMELDRLNPEQQRTDSALLYPPSYSDEPPPGYSELEDEILSDTDEHRTGKQFGSESNSSGTHSSEHPPTYNEATFTSSEPLRQTNI
ncbi:unnamed protein product [Owenia fusiformis]|uniref:Uncharacterized protein n=1 Tax=Owenia fusiformis TaxID=6347 RepID=A0A8J1TWH9_OWEFU|nr:unnamed protein product [Owenia fusiformis]